MMREGRTFLNRGGKVPIEQEFDQSSACNLLTY
jgi:hypothetical protein